MSNCQPRPRTPVAEVTKRGEDYWLCSKGQASRHWYVCFCLLMSCIHDCLTGIALRNQSAMNWSASASYYSMVHGCRLLCFLPIGDYPTGHSHMRELFAGRGTVRLDWLAQFAPHKVQTIHVQNAELVKLVPSAEQLAQPLKRLANLRNDSNYQALLIAHERRHDEVTPAFADLICLAGRAALLAVEAAVEAYREAVAGGRWAPVDAEALRCQSDEYIEFRLFQELQQKFGGDADCADCLQGLAGRLLSGRPAINHPDIQVIEAQISLDQFGGKRRVMHDFRHKIQQLAECLG